MITTSPFVKVENGRVLWIRYPHKSRVSDIYRINQVVPVNENRMLFGIDVPSSGRMETEKKTVQAIAKYHRTQPDAVYENPVISIDDGKTWTGKDDTHPDLWAFFDVRIHEQELEDIVRINKGDASIVSSSYKTVVIKHIAVSVRSVHKAKE